MIEPFSSLRRKAASPGVRPVTDDPVMIYSVSTIVSCGSQCAPTFWVTFNLRPAWRAPEASWRILATMGDDDRDKGKTGRQSALSMRKLTGPSTAVLVRL